MATPPTAEKMAEKYAGLREHPEAAAGWMAGVMAERKRVERETAAGDAIFGSKLPARARLVFLAMLRFSVRATPVGFENDLGPTTIALQTGLSVRSVKRELDTLGKAGWIRPTVDGHVLFRTPLPAAVGA